MSKITKIQMSGLNLPIPDIKILRYHYSCGISSWNFRNRSSPFWYLWRTQQKGGFLEFDGNIYELKTDEFILIPPYTPFSTGSRNGSFNQFYIHFTTGDSFREIRREIISIPAGQIRFDCGEEDFFISLSSNFKQMNTLLPLKLYTLVYQLLLSIPERYFLPEDALHTDKRIIDALEYFNKHMKENYTNEKICRTLGMSVNNFIRLFKQETGFSPLHYLLVHRIDTAKNLLIHTSLSIDEIAVQVGFANRFHFSRVFKQLTETTPAKYRRESQPLT